MKLIRIMTPYLLKFKTDMVVFIVTSLALWSLSMLIPYITGNYIDRLVDAEDEIYVWQTIAVLFVIWTMNLILSYVRNIISVKANIRISFAVRFDMLEHLKHLPLRYFKDKDAAYINQRVATDTGSLTGFVLGNVVGLFTTGLTFVFALVIIFIFNKTVALMLCFVFPLYILIYLKFRRPLYEMAYKVAEESNEFHGMINRQLDYVELIKQNSLIECTAEEAKSEFESLYATIMKNARLSYIVSNADAVVRYFANVIIFVYSGLQIIRGNMTIGQFTIINTYCIMIISGLSVFLNFGRGYRNVLVSCNRIDEIMYTMREENGSVTIDNVESIKVRSLNFNSDGRLIISDLSAEFKKGFVYGIAGENGTGKSTFLSILTGLEREYTGDVLLGHKNSASDVNTINLRAVDAYAFRQKCIAIVAQEPVFYLKTLRDNLGYADCELMIYKLGLGDLISALPGGLDYNVSEKSAGLSGGEKQRLALVGAFSKNADVLVLDEPSSALDENNGRLLREGLLEIKGSRITIIVTHDDALLDICDEVIVFERGYE